MFGVMQHFGDFGLISGRGVLLIHILFVVGEILGPIRCFRAARAGWVWGGETGLLYLGDRVLVFSHLGVVGVRVSYSTG